MAPKGRFVERSVVGKGGVNTRLTNSHVRQTQAIEVRSECSVNQSLPPIFAQLPKNPNGNWKFIFDTHAAYYKRNLNNPHSVVLAHQFLLIAKNSYDGYAAGWAGDFVEFVFMHTSNDLKDNPKFWDNPPGTTRHRLHMHCSPADIDFSALAAGGHHFERHLKVSFYNYVNEKMSDIVRKSKDKMKDLTSFVKALVTEHKAFFEKAVVPSFKQVNELTWVARQGAMMKVPGDATDLRNDTFRRVFEEMRTARKISSAEKISLEAAASIGIFSPNSLKSL